MIRGPILLLVQDQRLRQRLEKLLEEQDVKSSETISELSADIGALVLDEVALRRHESLLRTRAGDGPFTLAVLERERAEEVVSSACDMVDEVILEPVEPVELRLRLDLARGRKNAQPGPGGQEDANGSPPAEDLLFRSLFEESFAVMLVIDRPSGSIVDANRAAETYYGYSRDELRRLKIWQLNTLPPEAVREVMARAAAEGRGYFEFEHRLASGEVRSVEVYTGPVSSYHHDLLYSIVHDVTARHRAQKALRESEERFRRFFQNMNEALAIDELILDEDGKPYDWRVLEANPSFETVFGLPPQQAVGRRVRSLYGPEFDIDRVLVSVAEVVRTGEPVRMEAEFPLTGRCISTSIFSLGGTRFATASTDITLRRKAESERERLLAELERRAAELDASVASLHAVQEQRDVYVHTISHDLRVPLSVIQGHGQLLHELLKEGAQDVAEEMNESIEAILRNTRRMNVMIRDLVDAARIEGGKLSLELRPISLASYLDTLLERSDVMVEMERVRTDVPEDLPAVSADPDRLDRILMNLVSNALKYSPPQEPVVVAARRQGEEVVVSVIDRGAGVAPEDLPHIFDRFYRARGARKVQGVGLGLYITRMLVQAHGGRVWVESEAERGSTFCFSLPVAS